MTSKSQNNISVILIGHHGAMKGLQIVVNQKLLSVFLKLTAIVLYSNEVCQ